MPNNKESEEPITKAVRITAAQKDIIKNAFVRIAVAENYLKKFEDIAHFAKGDRQESANAPFSYAYGLIYQEILKKVHYAYRDFFMLANIFPDLAAEARAIAKEKVSERVAVSHLGDPEGNCSMYADSEIREAVAAALKARED